MLESCRTALWRWRHQHLISRGHTFLKVDLMFRPLSDQICCLTIQMLCANVSGGALCVCEWRNSYTIWINGFCGWPNNHSFFTDRMLLCVSGRMMDWIFLDHKMKTFLKTSFRNLTGIVWRFGKNALKETHKKKTAVTSWHHTVVAGQPVWMLNRDTGRMETVTTVISTNAVLLLLLL